MLRVDMLEFHSQADAGMTDSSLPVEILEFICEELIMEYTNERGEEMLLPRWYLLPLLLVCKLWHLVSVRYLYRSISLGSSFPYRWIQTIAGPPTLASTRKPHMIAYSLLLALKRNSRFAMMVEELHILWQLHYIDNVSINTLLVQICPNLRHVDIRAANSSITDTLSMALAEKSLVSLRISLRDDFDSTSFPIFYLMQRWPKIRWIRVEGRNSPRWQKKLQDSQATETLNCCPELREVILTHECLRKSSLASLRRMCSAITKLAICVYYSDTETLDTLCGCLRAWSPTLESLSLALEPMTSSHDTLSDALSSLTNLRELHVRNFYLDVGAISSLPKLIQFGFIAPHSDTVMDHLATLLEYPDTFTALIEFAVHGVNRDVSRKLQDVCQMRNIELKI